MAYATVDDLVAGWSELSAGERRTASVLLDRASSLLDMRIIEKRANPEDLTDLQLAICKIIVCDAVRYSLDNPTYGSAAMYEAATVPMAGEMVGGSLYITDKHMEMLGFTRTSAGFIGGVHED